MKLYPAIILMLPAAYPGANNNPRAEQIIEVAAESPDEIGQIFDLKYKGIAQLYREGKIVRDAPVSSVPMPMPGE